MLIGSKIRALTLLAAVFVAGGAVGWLGHDWSDRGHWRRGRRGVDSMVEHLSRELRLSVAQRDSVRAILERRREETDAFWREARSRFDTIRAAARAEIEEELTPEQRARYERLAEKDAHRRERAAKNRDGEQEGGAGEH